MLEETITHTQHIYQGRVVNLNVHDVRLPDGKTGKRELIQHPGAVAIVALDADDHVLLIRQFRLGAGQVMIELPAGTLEPGEQDDLTAAATRELQEETGYRARQMVRIGGWFVAPGYSTEYIHLFLGQGLEAAPATGDEDEFIEQFRVPFEQALAMIDRGEIFNTTAICGLIKAARHRLR